MYMNILLIFCTPIKLLFDKHKNAHLIEIRKSIDIV